MKRAVGSGGSAVPVAEMPALQGEQLAGLPASLAHGRPVAVIGAGPAGVAVAQGLVSVPDGPPVVLIGEEDDPPYNRVRLTPFLAGEATESELRIGGDLDEADADRFARLAGCRIASIDANERVVRDTQGTALACAAIVLATGSRPLLPPIPGVELEGVHTFRTLADARTLDKLAPRTSRAVVIGGGLLGLEAARGLALHECPVSVVERSDGLMSAQLEGEAAQRLLGMVEAHGVDVRLASQVDRIDGKGSVQSVVLAQGDAIECDLVIVAVGVRPNIDLAREGGLETRRGIVVDRQMRTSVPGILAVGECAELEGCVQGLAGPALAQARVAVDTVLGNQRAYEPGVAASRLKIFDHPVFSIGSPATAGRRVEWASGDAYRSLTTRWGRLVAAAGIGEWSELHEVQRAVSDRRFLWPWQTAGFRATGVLKRREETIDPGAWAADRIVCNCTQTTCGQLRSARASGCQTVEALQQHTGASRVCGSCHDLVGLFADRPAANAPLIEGQRRWQLLAAIAIGLVLAVAFLPRLPIPSSVDTIWFDLSVLWRDGGWRQVTGYSLLACLFLMLGLSARKRLKPFRLSSAAFWRWCHALSGTLLLLLVGVHTALAWGGLLTTLLLGLLIAASLLGAVSGSVGPSSSPGTRRIIFWGHLLLVWPLPVLLAFHILSVYWF
jgi:nitrite reductase (NADH) large subunit